MSKIYGIPLSPRSLSDLSQFRPEIQKERGKFYARKHKPDRLLESEVPKTGYLFGPELKLADIAIATHFINLSYGEVKVDGAAYPALAGYVQRLMQHPAMAHQMAEDWKMLST